MYTPNEILQFVERLNTDIDNKKTDMISVLGGDPGHDIGDASDAVELLDNILFERCNEELREYAQAMSVAYDGIEGFEDSDKIFQFIMDYADLPEEQWEAIKCYIRRKNG